MKILSKISSRISRAVIITALLVSGIVPMAGMLAPAAVSAASCNSAGGAGGGGLLSLYAESPEADSGVAKIGFEVTPAADWGEDIDTQGSFVKFADSSCTYLNSNLSYGISKTGALTIDYTDNTRTGAFVDGTDYDNAFTGVTVTPSSNTEASASYAVTGLTADTPVLVSVDLSNDGWVDVYLKVGSGSDQRMVSFLAAADTTSFYFTTGTGYLIRYGYFEDFGDCDGFTGSSSVEARILFDGAAQDLETHADGTCSSFAANDYDSGSKTATLGYDVEGADVQHTVDLDGGSGGIKAATVDSSVFATSSLALSGDNKNFTGTFTSSSSSSQQIYLTVNESQDGKALPKDTPWPIAGGVFDMSAGNTDLSDVVLDTSPGGYAALAHNLAGKTKDGSFTLFVPYRAGDKYIGICAGASALTGVGSKCTGIYYVKDGQTKTNKDTKSIPDGRSVKATVITVGTKKFWQVDGLTGTGAFSSNLASDPDTGISASATSIPVIVLVTFATVALAFYARRATVKVKK